MCIFFFLAFFSSIVCLPASLFYPLFSCRYFVYEILIILQLFLFIYIFLLSFFFLTLFNLSLLLFSLFSLFLSVVFPRTFLSYIIPYIWESSLSGWFFFWKDGNPCSNILHKLQRIENLFTKTRRGGEINKIRVCPRGLVHSYI